MESTTLDLVSPTPCNSLSDGYFVKFAPALSTPFSITLLASDFSLALFLAFRLFAVFDLCGAGFSAAVVVVVVVPVACAWAEGIRHEAERIDNAAVKTAYFVSFVMQIS
jgi:hypothetical protein